MVCVYVHFFALFLVTFCIVIKVLMLRATSRMTFIALIGVLFFWGHRTLCVPFVAPPVSLKAIKLQAIIDASIVSGRSSVAITPGDYVFSNSSLFIAGAKDLTIRATGVRLIFFFGSGLLISDSINVTVYGLTFDALPPNYAQGKLTKITDSSTFIASFDERFLLPDTTTLPFSSPGGSAGAKVSFWDPDTRLMTYNSNFLNSSIFVVNDSYQISLKNSQSSGMSVGNLVTIFPRSGYTWKCMNCSRCTANGITINAGGNMGFLEVGGLGKNRYTNVSIQRKRGSPGLIALNADGFHSSDVGVGPILEDSEISFTGDDFLNIHNKMKIVCKILSSTMLAIVDPGTSFAELGAFNELKFYELLPGKPTRANAFIESGIVAHCTQANMSLFQECREIGKVIENSPYNVSLISTVAAEIAKAQVYIVNFSAPLTKVSRYNLVNFEERSGSEFIVRNNHFHDSCGSGGRVITKSINGSIVNNVFSRFGGVHIYSEQVWLEGALGIRNIYAGDNIIINARSNTTHIDVLPELRNITCINNSFVSDNATIQRLSGC